MPSSQRTLLEAERLPIAELAVLADRESRQPQAIYKTHKWFARRLGTSMRALVLGLTYEDESAFWENFGGAPQLSGTLLDPFVGGGTIITEASRLGMDVIGVDVDPVAAAITGFQMALADAPSVLPVLEELMRDVGSTIAPFHQVISPEGGTLVAVHHFWVQVHRCEACDVEFELHPTYEIGRTPSLGTRALVCSECGAMAEVPLETEYLKCSCGARTPSAAGPVSRGVARCPACGHTEALISAARRTLVPPRFRLFAHEVFDPEETKRPTMAKRRFIAATSHSREILESCEQRLQTEGTNLPHATIGAHHRDTRLIAYNRTSSLELFTLRQRLHLARLLRALDLLEEPAKQAAAIAFSDHLRTNNLLCGYASGWRRLRPLFTIRGWHHVVRPVELNPWLDGIGRGTFPNAMRRIEKARLQARRPRGARPCTPSSFQSVHVRQGTSSRLPDVPDASIDYVITDPPYFDKLSYGELADFFRPWMRHLRLVGDADGAADEQLASMASRSDQGEAFSAGLTACLREVARKLKPLAPFVFTYQAGPAGWLATTQALQRTGLDPVSVQPMLGDAGSGDHKRGNPIRWDAVLCLRKPENWRLGRAREFRCDARDVQQARATTERGERRAKAGKVPFHDSDKRNLLAAALCMAVLVRRRRGKWAPLADVLDKECRTSARSA